jgi:cold shock CspA family protein
MPNDQITKTGIVRQYIETRGFGFITADDGADVFFHISAVGEQFGEPTKGDRVTFVPGAGRDGRPRANKVVVLPKSGPLR